jgi:CDP-glucose 4,6-dehydratase
VESILTTWRLDGTIAICRQNIEVIDLLINNWGPVAGWTQDQSEQPYEAHSLKLDCSKAQQYLNWIPRWSLEKAIQNIVKWQLNFQQSGDMREASLEQISNYQYS